MFSAISGLKQHQVMLDVTANDIANVNTIGYKSARVTFQDSLNQLQRGAAGANTATGGTNAAQVGLGVKLGSIDNLMGTGTAQTTGSPLDVSITGEGFFQIGEGNPNGAANAPIDARTYTRSGNFSVSTQGYLTNSAGQYVVGYQLDPGTGNPITTGVAIKIPDDASNVAIDTNGGVSWVDNGTGLRTTGYRLTLANFANASGLERVGGNSWAVSANSGNKTVNTPGEGGAAPLNPGTLEMSNVDLSQTFTNMITAQRGFQANSRVISTADEMLQDLVNLKR
ncbi:flagellar hook-basal body complex protein [Solirubrobacter phytolaccae]|uniref:Flagellar hook protein FlgE n=1 Tax=Solirubrobacter phytolaccae TaxID=1404360 RepID=A0A9X3NH52_9ACTN|nr:flagellar hook-basal body complex protein [Solirubrobacter phytolaccae]MDA0183851.1 flagellar hook-basal body complex protein [Solirubrobacter phytolaccae]